MGTFTGRFWAENWAVYAHWRYKPVLGKAACELFSHQA